MANYNRQKWMDLKHDFMEQIIIEYSTKPCFCYLCGRILDVQNITTISIDHFIPRAEHDPLKVEIIDNLRPTHEECNNLRGSNRVQEKKYFDKNLQAEVHKYKYKDIHRTTWNIRFAVCRNTSRIEVKICKKLGNGQTSTENASYDFYGNKLDKKNVMKYYNHNPANYGKWRKSRGGSDKCR